MTFGVLTFLSFFVDSTSQRSSDIRHAVLSMTVLRKKKGAVYVLFLVQYIYSMVDFSDFFRK